MYGMTETVRVEFADWTVDDRETIVGLRDAVILGLLEDAVRAMDPEKAPRDLAVIFEVELDPPAIVRFAGVAVSWKVGG